MMKTTLLEENIPWLVYQKSQEKKISIEFGEGQYFLRRDRRCELQLNDGKELTQGYVFTSSLSKKNKRTKDQISLNYLGETLRWFSHCSPMFAKLDQYPSMLIVDIEWYLHYSHSSSFVDQMPMNEQTHFCSSRNRFSFATRRDDVAPKLSNRRTMTKNSFLLFYWHLKIDEYTFFVVVSAVLLLLRRQTIHFERLVTLYFGIHCLFKWKLRISNRVFRSFHFFRFFNFNNHKTTRCELIFHQRQINVNDIESPSDFCVF